MRRLFPLVLVVGCGTTQPPPSPTTSATPTPTTTPAPTTTATTPVTSPTTTTPSTTTVECEQRDDLVRFVALGDAGEANTDQQLVADAMAQVCAQRCCDFALYLGDNFYNSGVDDSTDSMFQTHFEDIYAAVDFPFFVVLGNHDYGAEGLGLEVWKSEYYIDYALTSSKFVFPDTYYDFHWSHAHFLALNTTELFFGFTDQQASWVQDVYATMPKDTEWVLSFGHHPYISNGQHGNAGEYEGIAEWVPLTEIPRGQYVKEFFDANICGQTTVYLSGHDHNRQFLVPTCGTEFIVSGTGAKTTGLEGRGNPTFFEDDSVEGFLWVEIDGGSFTGAFYDKYANVDYEQTFTL